MNDIILLIKIQILDLFKINKIRYAKGKKEKFKQMFYIFMFFILFVFIVLTSFSYSYGMSVTLQMIDALELLPIIMMVATTAAVFFTTIYKSNGILFGFKDYDMLMSLPVKTSSIIASRIIMLNLTNIFTSLIIMIPAIIVYAMKSGPELYFYIMNLILLVFIPIIPIITATALGYGINIAASKFKHTNAVNIFLSIFLFIGFIIVSSKMSTIQNVDNLVNIKNDLLNILYKYPMVKLYSVSVLTGNIMSLFMFIIISSLFFGLFIIVISRKFKYMNTKFQAKSVNADYKFKELKVSSHFLALYKKELKRYFSSPLYVLNTSIGVVFFTFVTIGTLFMGLDKMGAMLEIPNFAENINKFAPFFISVIMVMSCTTASSISLEGKELWILKTLPIKVKTIFLSKIAVNITILVPAVLFNCTIISVLLNLNFVQTIFLFITPLNYSIFISIFGLFINLKFPKMNWVSETAVIKQSAAVMLSLLIGIASAVLPILILTKIVWVNDLLLTFILNLSILIINFLIYKYLNSNGIKTFLNLE